MSKGSLTPETRPKVRAGLLLFTGRYPGQSEQEVLADALTLALAAERHGFQEVWTTEHHFNPALVSASALTLAAFLLGRTRTLKVGTGAVVLPLYPPVAVAEEAAMLALLSGGRFLLGVARGGPMVDLLAYGSSLERRNAGFGSALDLLLAALNEGRAQGEDAFFSFPEVSLVPRAPSLPPVVLACNTPTSASLAAARALPMMLGPQLDDAGREALISHYAGAARRAGHDPARVAHYAAVVVHLSGSRGEAEAELRASWVPWFARSQEAAPFLEPPPPLPLEAFHGLVGLQAVGTPGDVTVKLAATAERTGLHQFMFVVDASGNRAQAVATIKGLAEEVLPKLDPLWRRHRAEAM